MLICRLCLCSHGSHDKENSLSVFGLFSCVEPVFDHISDAMKKEKMNLAPLSAAAKTPPTSKDEICPMISLSDPYEPLLSVGDVGRSSNTGSP